MTVTPKSPAQQIPTQTWNPKVVQQEPTQTDDPKAPPKAPEVSQSDPVQQKTVQQDPGQSPVQQSDWTTPPTAGSPVQQEPAKQSFFSKNAKWLSILGGGVAGGALGFFTLGIPGAIGGAAVGAGAGYLLWKHFHKDPATATQQTPNTG